MVAEPPVPFHVEVPDVVVGVEVLPDVSVTSAVPREVPLAGAMVRDVPDPAVAEDWLDVPPRPELGPLWTRWGLPFWQTALIW